MPIQLFSIGPFTVQGYGLMIALGIIAAVLVAGFRAKKQGLDQDKLFTMVLWGVLCGFVGAKLLYYLTRLQDIIADPSLLLDFADGFVVYGGIITGFLAPLIYAKIKKIPFLRYLDVAVPSLALAQGFGRIGCAIAGCCYGLPTDGPFAVVAANGERLFPIQLVSSGLNFLHFLVLILIARHWRKEGVTSACYLIFYSVGRFIIEFFRGDLIRGSVGELSTSQFISLFMFAFGVGMLVWVARRKAPQLTEPSAEPQEASAAASGTPVSTQEEVDPQAAQPAAEQEEKDGEDGAENGEDEQ